MSTAAKAISAMPERDRPLSEEFRLVARQWADEDAAASLLEELKTTTLEKLKSKIMAGADMAENKAERLAKISPDRSEYIERMCGHRAKASRLKVQMEYIRMRFAEVQSKEASARHEARLSK